MCLLLWKMLPKTSWLKEIEFSLTLLGAAIMLWLEEFQDLLTKSAYSSWSIQAASKRNGLGPLARGRPPKWRRRGLW